MGSVYEAESLLGEGKRAIKLLRQDLVHEDQIVRRFLAEAVAVRELQHPNVAQVLDAATAENGTPYLVMELLQGTPLSKYVEHGHVMPPQQAVQVVRAILHALGAAHSRNVIHRDVKPENVFLVRDPSGAFVVKVLDFGIAKVMDAAGRMAPMTRTGVLLGTPGYMSPEQIKSSNAVDATTDLWSAGVILYELLTGQAPFPADNELARLSAVLDEEMRPIDEIAPHLAAWRPFFQRALAKNPRARFASAEEMEQALLSTTRGALAPGSPQALSNGSRPSTPDRAWLRAAESDAAANRGEPNFGAHRPDLMSASPASSVARVPPLRGVSATIAASRFERPADIADGANAAAAVVPRALADPGQAVVAEGPAGAPWWLVGVITAIAFGVGLGVGLWIGLP
jgi:serine/threonine-protein kinase